MNEMRDVGVLLMLMKVFISRLLRSGLRQMQEPIAPMSNLPGQDVRDAELGGGTRCGITQVSVSKFGIGLSSDKFTFGQKRSRVIVLFPSLQLLISHVSVDGIPAGNATPLAFDTSSTFPGRRPPTNRRGAQLAHSVLHGLGHLLFRPGFPLQRVPAHPQFHVLRFSLFGEWQWRRNRMRRF